MPTYIDPINGKNTFKYTKADDSTNKNKSIKFENLKSTLHQNKIFSKSEIDQYGTFNRYGWIDTHEVDQISREYLFFTKPDLYIFDGTSLSGVTLNKSLESIPFFRDAYNRNLEALAQLQANVKDKNNRSNPFICLLSNRVTSKMDLPALSSEAQDSTSNLYGTNISYRSHSLKSDNGFDFTLSFTDADSLPIYTMVKAYDEYMRLYKTGQIDCWGDKAGSGANRYKNYIINRILNEQFSIYKFIIGSDGETILYYAKATGVYFTDVPRSDFGDPPSDGFKYSLSFHANFIEDMNPMILQEFNCVSNANPNSTEYADVYNFDNPGINNEWVMYPCIRSTTNGGRVNEAKDFRLKWTNTNKSGGGKYSGGGTYGQNGTTLTGSSQSAGLSSSLDNYVSPDSSVSPASGGSSTFGSGIGNGRTNVNNPSVPSNNTNVDNTDYQTTSLRVRITDGLESIASRIIAAIT